MARQLQHKGSRLPFKGGRHQHPGCMPGLLHLFDFHQRFHIRKMLMDRKHGMGRKIPAAGRKNRVTQTLATPASKEGVSVDNSSVDDDDEEDASRSSTSETSEEAEISEEVSKHEQHMKQRNPQASSRLRRTNSIHHNLAVDINFDIEEEASPPREPTSEKPTHCQQHCNLCDSRCSDVDSGHDHLDQFLMSWSQQRVLKEKLNEARLALLKQLNSGISSNPQSDASVKQAKDFLNALELIDANNDVFLKILRDPTSISATDLQEIQSPMQGSMLAKVDSFLTSGSFRRSNSCGERENNDGPGQEEDVGVDDFSLRSNSSSSESHSDDHSCSKMRGNGKAMHLFKNIKARLKDIIKESKRENPWIAMDGVLHKIPYGQKISPPIEVPFPTEIFKRSHSLDESVHKYAQLFDHDKNLKSDRNSSKGLGRIHSLPNAPPYFLVDDAECRKVDAKFRSSVETGEASEDNFHDIPTGKPILDLDVEPYQEDVFYSPVSTRENSVIRVQRIGFDGMDESFEIDADLLENVKDKVEFSYIKEVLDRSGFSEGNSLSWYSSNLPMDPSLFLELEELDLYHVLLFDLLNEILEDIYETSFGLYPRSWNPTLEGSSRMFEEVWANIRWHLNFQFQTNDTLEPVIQRDMMKDEWMDIGKEKENLGMKLEKYILDDLLVKEVENLFHFP